MTKEELASRLNGRQYRFEISKAEELEAHASGLIVIFGASDDLLEFRGAIDDEVGAWGGKIVFITPNGLLNNECDDDDCPYFQKIVVNAEWDKDGYSWVITSNLSYAPFDILEDGEKYCRGIVINILTKEENESKVPYVQK